MTPTKKTTAAAAEAPTAEPSDIIGLSYEESRAELISVVQRLEAGNVSLEESLALWERGEALAKHCQDWLDGAQQRLDAARQNNGEDAASGEDSARAEAPTESADSNTAHTTTDKATGLKNS